MAEISFTSDYFCVNLSLGIYYRIWLLLLRRKPYCSISFQTLKWLDSYVGLCVDASWRSPWTPLQQVSSIPQQKEDVNEIKM